jgi:hypothetical protein
MLANESKRLERFIDRLGLRHFRAAELTPYWSRTRGGTRNSIPPSHLWPNIVETLKVADEGRERAGVPLVITSSYRNQQYNRAVGGASRSRHLHFNALDLVPKGITPKQLADIFRDMRRNGFFSGGIGLYSTFVHIDTRGYDADF